MKNYFISLMAIVSMNEKSYQMFHNAVSMLALGLAVLYILNPSDWKALFFLFVIMDVVLIAMIRVWAETFSFITLTFEPSHPSLFKWYNVFCGLLTGFILVEIIKVIISLSS